MSKMQYAVSVYYMLPVGDGMFLRLRDIREDRDKTQAQMAELLGCSQQTYSRYECGKAQMSYQTMDYLAEYFGTSVDYLLGRTDEKTPYSRSKRKENT